MRRSIRILHGEDHRNFQEERKLVQRDTAEVACSKWALASRVTDWRVPHGSLVDACRLVKIGEWTPWNTDLTQGPISVRTSQFPAKRKYMPGRSQARRFETFPRRLKEGDREVIERRVSCEWHCDGGHKPEADTGADCRGLRTYSCNPRAGCEGAEWRLRKDACGRTALL